MIHIIGNGQQAKVVRMILARQLHGAQPKNDQWIIAIGNNSVRKSKVEHDKEYWTAIDPSALFVEDGRIGNGSTVGLGVTIGPDVSIGAHCIINDRACLTHDIMIEDFCHIAPGAILCGNVHVGEGALVGAGAICLPGARIEPWTTVKAGSVVRP